MKSRARSLSLVCITWLLTAVSASGQPMPSPLQVSETSQLNGTFVGTWTFAGTSGRGSWNNGAAAALAVDVYDGVNVTITRVDDVSSPGAGLSAVYTGQRSGNAFAGSVTWTWPGRSGYPTTGVWSGTFIDVTTAQPPTGLIAHSIVGNLVTLRWTPPTSGPAATSYVMEGGVVPGQVLASIPTGSAVPLFAFAAPNGAFYLRVHTQAGSQRSVASNEIRVFVNQAVAPSAPSHLLGLVNGSAVALSWRPTFGGGTAASYVLDVSGTINASLPVGLADSFIFNGVPGGSYTFRVRAVNAFGASGASNSVPLTFPSPCTGAPQTPADFLAYRVGNTVHLLWNPAAAGPAQTSFVLNVTGAINLSLPLPTRGISAPVPPGSYTFTVAAANACGTSAATAAQTVVVP